MKKYILIIFALIAICACESRTQSTQLSEGNSLDYPDTYLKYRGHRYYIWYIHSGIGVVHDPDCPCYKRNITTNNILF